MCLSRLEAIQPSFAACGSGAPLRLRRTGVQPDVPRTSGCRTLAVLIPAASTNKNATARVAFLFGGGGGNRTRVRKSSTGSTTYLVRSFDLTTSTPADRLGSSELPWI